MVTYISSQFHGTFEDSVQIRFPTLWLHCEYLSRFHISLPGCICCCRVLASGLFVLVLTAMTTPQVSSGALSPPISSPGNDTQHSDTCVGKIFVCMQQKLTLADYTKKRDLWKGCWIIWSTARKTMKLVRHWSGTREARRRAGHCPKSTPRVGLV